MTRNKRNRNWSGAPPWKIGTGAIAPVAPLVIANTRLCTKLLGSTQKTVKNLCQTKYLA